MANMQPDGSSNTGKALPAVLTSESPPNHKGDQAMNIVQSALSKAAFAIQEFHAVFTVADEALTTADKSFLR